MDESKTNEKLIIEYAQQLLNKLIIDKDGDLQNAEVIRLSEFIDILISNYQQMKK